MRHVFWGEIKHLRTGLAKLESQAGFQAVHNYLSDGFAENRQQEDRNNLPRKHAVCVRALSDVKNCTGNAFPGSAFALEPHLPNSK